MKRSELVVRWREQLQELHEKVLGPNREDWKWEHIQLMFWNGRAFDEAITRIKVECMIYDAVRLFDLMIPHFEDCDFCPKLVERECPDCGALIQDGRCESCAQMR